MYASDLARAMETARILAAPHGIAVRSDARLREFAFGAWEGLTWPEIVATRPDLEGASWSRAANYAPEGGETFAQVRDRVRAFFEELAGGAAERHVVVVTHAGPLHAAIDALQLALPGAGEEGGLGVVFAPASLTRIAMEGGRARLITLNDVRHLDSTG